MRAAVAFWTVVLFTGFTFAQQSCFTGEVPWLMQPCAGDPTLMECMQVTTTLTNDKGGESAAILQELCFKQGSPLFGGPDYRSSGIFMTADKGTLSLDALTVGEPIGQIRFELDLASLGVTECPAPWPYTARLVAPIQVVAKDSDSATLSVRITEATSALVECLLLYDPTDIGHNGGQLLDGELTLGSTGGFELFLWLSSLAPEATDPGLQYNDVAGISTPAPLYFQPITKDGVFVLPAEGGALTITTTLSAQFVSGGLVVTTNPPFEETFTIKPRVVEVAFLRGYSNTDRELDIADAVFILNYLFAEGPAPTCLDAADANDSGAIDTADVVALLRYVFTSVGSLPEPLDACDVDPTPEDALDCSSFPPCMEP